MASSTTIKVPVALRDRVNRDAAARGLTAAELLTELVEEYERRARLDAFGAAFARADDADDGYASEQKVWETVEASEWPDA